MSTIADIEPEVNALADQVIKNKKKGITGSVLALADVALLLHQLKELRKAIANQDKREILKHYGKFYYVLYSLRNDYNLKDQCENLIEKLTEIVLSVLEVQK